MCTVIKMENCILLILIHVPLIIWLSIAILLESVLAKESKTNVISFFIQVELRQRSFLRKCMLAIYFAVNY